MEIRVNIKAFIIFISGILVLAFILVAMYLIPKKLKSESLEQYNSCVASKTEGYYKILASCADFRLKNDYYPSGCDSASINLVNSYIDKAKVECDAKYLRN